MEVEQMLFQKIKDHFNKSGCNYLFAGTALAIPFTRKLGLEKNIPFGVCTQPSDDIFNSYKVCVINILGDDKNIFPKSGQAMITLHATF